MRRWESEDAEWPEGSNSSPFLRKDVPTCQHRRAFKHHRGTPLTTKQSSVPHPPPHLNPNPTPPHTCLLPSTFQDKPIQPSTRPPIHVHLLMTPTLLYSPLPHRLPSQLSHAPQFSISPPSHQKRTVSAATERTQLTVGSKQHRQRERYNDNENTKTKRDKTTSRHTAHGTQPSTRQTHDTRHTAK